MSARGNKFLFIAYSYDNNGILWKPMKSKNDDEMIRVFDKVHHKLIKRGIKLTFHVMDNEASGAVISWLERNKVDAQKVPPHNHREKNLKG